MSHVEKISNQRAIRCINCLALVIILVVHGLEGVRCEFWEWDRMHDLGICLNLLQLAAFSDRRHSIRSHYPRYLIVRIHGEGYDIAASLVQISNDAVEALPIGLRIVVETMPPAVPWLCST